MANNNEAPTWQQIDDGYPDIMDQFICPACSESFDGWSSLHAHMRVHDAEEREAAYARYDTDRLKEAAIALWRQDRE